jgi:Ca-activated chloride channel family protein
MNVGLEVALSDLNVDANQASSQRQAAISVFALPQASGRSVPLNLGLVLDHSGSMRGRPLDTVKQAAQELLQQLQPGDRITLIGFNHEPKVLIPNQAIESVTSIAESLQALMAAGGTNIDEALKLGIEELAKGKKDAISQMFLLTDGENEHGDNDRCLKLAELAAGYSMTIHALGFGDQWNQDVLEKIADAGGGVLSYIQAPEQATAEFDRVLGRMQAVGLTNAFLALQLSPQVRLAQLKPLAQVAPETIELSVIQEGDTAIVRLGDLLVDAPRVILANLYLDQLPPGEQTIAQIQVRYDDPATGQTELLTPETPIVACIQTDYQPALNPTVQPHILALAKYRQTQIAEQKLHQGDRQGAATMLQTAAQTALQMGDRGAATVLQVNATRLQAGESLSDSDKKQTRLVSKTVLQGN